MSQNLIGVPIVETGIEYPTSTGKVTFTTGDLTAIVDSQQDPAIVAPRLKLGHSDSRFALQDGEPAFGVAKNLRLDNSGHTVICDYYGVPDWLANVLPTAYPNRSIEGNWDVETVTGHKWPFVVTDVALLGVVWPGISTLDDLQIAMSDAGPKGVSMATAVMAESVSDTPWSNFKDSDYTDEQYARSAVYDRGKCSADMQDATAKQRYSLPVREPDGKLNRNAVHGAAGRLNQVTGGCADAMKAAATTLINLYKNSLKEDPPETLVKMAASLEASINAEDVQRSFYSEFATQDEGRYFWWIRAVLLNPNELIVDDDDGGLYRVPFSATKNDAIKFSDPVPVKVQYVDQPAQAASFAGALVAASFSNSSESRPEQRSKDRVTTVNAAINLDRLRQRLSLPADATEDDINVALTQEENPPAGTDPAPADSSQSGTVSEGSGEENEPTPDPPAEGTAASAANAGAVLVDKDVFATLQRDAAMGRQAFERQRITDRDTFLHAAVTNGKFAPARLQHWQNAWEKDPEGTKAAVDSLAAGLIPVGQVGIVSNEEGDTGPAYPAQLFPELQRRRQATSTIQQES